MAEYYPLLAKAVGSLPNSTPDTRRVVYERARKALIGQLRTLHPPVPDEDIERESVALDKAIERLEGELAAAPPAPPSTAPNAPPAAPAAAKPAPAPAGALKPIKPSAPPAPSATTAGAVIKKSPPPLRPRVPKPKDAPEPKDTPELKDAPAPSGETSPGEPKPGTGIAPIVAKPVDVVPPEAPSSERTPGTERIEPKSIEPELVLPEPVAKGGENVTKPGPGDNGAKPRLDVQRPTAPQPQADTSGKPRIWIIPAGIVVVLALVALAAWKLRDRPETLARSKPAEQTQGDAGKIADRVGGSPDNAQDNGQANAPEPPSAPTPDDTTPAKPEQPQAAQEQPAAQPAPARPAPATPQPAPAEPQSTPAANNPEVAVGYRAALLVEAPDEPEKVKTYLGTVVWKLNNVSGGGPSDTVGLAVEADIDIPTDGTKVVVTFEKNADASLPASHVIKVRFTVQPGSATGDVKRLSVPQMRREDVQTGVPLAGVSVPVLQNSFLVGLTPGNSESANLKLLGDLEWIDFPMLLSSGKIAKLTFDKGASGQRDLAEALAAWQKQ